MLMSDEQALHSRLHRRIAVEINKIHRVHALLRNQVGFPVHIAQPFTQRGGETVYRIREAMCRGRVGIAQEAVHVVRGLHERHRSSHIQCGFVFIALNPGETGTCGLVREDDELRMSTHCASTQGVRDLDVA